MARKEFADLNDLKDLRLDESIPAPKKPNKFAGRLFGIIKFILGIGLLPFVYSNTASFLNEVSLLDKANYGYFFSGVKTFLLIYLFIYEPAIIYNKGHKILELIFRFFTPLVKVAPYLLPIYTIVLFPLCGLFLIFNKEALGYFIFLFGFTIALHLVFSAKTLRRKQGDFLKSNYIFGFSFVYIVNIALVAFIFNMLFANFSFVNFCNNSYQTAIQVFYAVFKQLFLR